MLPTFSKNLNLQEAFQTSEELKRREFDGAFWKKIQTSSPYSFFIFSLNVETRQGK